MKISFKRYSKNASLKVKGENWVKMMSEKIEINTMITKHENKCKDCRFEMIDVEDPLWEYGSPLKRVLIDNKTGETYDSVSKLVGLLNEQQLVISKLDEDNTGYMVENRRLKEKYDYDIEDYRQSNAELKKENENLIQKNCISCELVNLQTREIDKLKEENKRLKKKLESLQKVLHLVECVSDE